MEIFKLVFSPIDVNTYILADISGNSAVIDCGCYGNDEFQVLAGFIEGRKLKPVILLNTHCHLDHIFGNRMFLEKYDLRPYCHKEESMNRKYAIQYARLLGLEMEEQPVPAGFLEDGQEISFGTEKLLVLHVPGHAPESLAFYSEKSKAVFTGDALFAGSVGRSDIPGGDHKLLIRSIENKLFVLPHDTAVYPGHGEATTIGTEIENNPYFRKGK